MSIPSDPKKIRERIRRYERNWKSPLFRDGSGTRFLIGPFYMLLGDIDGATKHYKWFDRKFPDSIDEPFHTLCRTLVKLRSDNPKGAATCLKRTYLANPYTIPALLKVPHGQPNIQRGSNWENEDYITEGPPELLTIWTQEELKWLREQWESQEMKGFVRRHIEIRQKLDSTPPGPTRSKLVDALYAMRDESTSKPRLKLAKD